MKRRLSSLDLLPEEAAPFVAEAAQAIRAGNKLDGDILFELNDKLATLGIDPISRSAFSRQAIKIKDATQRLRDAAEIYRAVRPEVDPDKMEEADIIRAEFIKTLIFNASQSDGLSPKEIMELARAHIFTTQAEAISQKKNSDKRRENKAAEETISKIRDANGVPAATKEKLIEALRESIR